MKKLLIGMVCAMCAGVNAQEMLTPEAMWKMGRVGEFAMAADGARIVYAQTNYDVAADKGTTDLWLQSTKGGAPEKIAENASAPVWVGDRLYFLRDGQLWMSGAGRAAGAETASAETAGKASGAESRNESRGETRPESRAETKLTDIDGGIECFGIAPAGGRIFYVRRVAVDPKTSAKRYESLPESRAMIYDDLMVRHWDRWTDGTHLHIFVAPFDGEAVGEARDIMAGEPWDAPMEPYFDPAEIAWNNAGTVLAYTCKKLTGAAYAVSTDSDVYLYDVASGETKNLTGGLDAGGAKAMPGYDKYPVWSPDDRLLAFRSMARPGFEADKERLMVWDFVAERFTDLTAGFDHSAMNAVWNGGRELLFTAPYFGTIQLFRVGLDGRVKAVTDGDYDVAAFSRAAGTTVAAITRQDRAPELYTVDVSRGSVEQLTHVNDEIFDGLKMGRIERRMVATTDGREMLTWVTYPPDFDPARKYPALLYCEGGPQSPMTQGWSYRWNYQLIAAQGYIVVAPCRRGVLSFGQEWTDQISGDYAGQNIRDYLSAIDEVAAEPYVDRERLGCVGASYGGYSVFYLAGVHEGRFKAFIAHCGIFDFDSMYGQTEELFFVNHDYGGAYWDFGNEVAQRSYAGSPHRLVQKWDTPILIFTGAMDFRIPYAQSLEAHTAARLRGIDSRLVVFENEAHQVFKPQNNLVWNAEFFGWLGKYLKK